MTSFAIVAPVVFSVGVNVALQNSTIHRRISAIDAIAAIAVLDGDVLISRSNISGETTIDPSQDVISTVTALNQRYLSNWTRRALCLSNESLSQHIGSESFGQRPPSWLFGVGGGLAVVNSRAPVHYRWESPHPLLPNRTTWNFVNITASSFVGLSNRCGGGVFVGSLVLLTVTNSEFANCFAFPQGTFPLSMGGAVLAREGSAVKVSGSSLRNNSAEFGGALLVFSAVELAVEGSAFKFNSASQDGGAVHAEGYQNVVAIRNCTFEGNTAADAQGGALLVGAATRKNRNTLAARSGREERFDANSPPPLFLRVLNATSTRRGDLSVFICQNQLSAVYDYDNDEFLNISAMRDKGYFSSVSTAVSIADCLFERNAARAKGGAIHVDFVADVRISNSVFRSNTVGCRHPQFDFEEERCLSCDGGGIYVECLSTVRISSSKFELNSARCGPDRSIDDGGAIRTGIGNTLVLTDVSFDRNYAKTNGGGLDMSDFSLAHARNVTFVQNVADSGGGANIGYFRSSQVDVADSLFLSNNASRSRGGGLFVYSSNVSIVGCLFDGNSAATLGGGMFVIGDPFEAPSTFPPLLSLVLSRCTFKNNRAGESGGAVAVHRSEDPPALFPPSLPSSEVCCCDSTSLSQLCLVSSKAPFNASGACIPFSAVSNTSISDAHYRKPFDVPLCCVRCVAEARTCGPCEVGPTFFHITKALIKSSDFDGNAASVGGALRLSNGAFDILSSHFTRNRADFVGGAIFFLGSSFANVSLDSTLSANSASSRLGTALFASSTYSSLELGSVALRGEAEGVAVMLQGIAGVKLAKALTFECPIGTFAVAEVAQNVTHPLPHSTVQLVSYSLRCATVPPSTYSLAKGGMAIRSFSANFVEAPQGVFPCPFGFNCSFTTRAQVAIKGDAANVTISRIRPRRGFYGFRIGRACFAIHCPAGFCDPDVSSQEALLDGDAWESVVLDCGYSTNIACKPNRVGFLCRECNQAVGYFDALFSSTCLQAQDCVTAQMALWWMLWLGLFLALTMILYVVKALTDDEGDQRVAAAVLENPSPLLISTSLRETAVDALPRSHSDQERPVAKGVGNLTAWESMKTTFFFGYFEDAMKGKVTCVSSGLLIVTIFFYQMAPIFCEVRRLQEILAGKSVALNAVTSAINLEILHPAGQAPLCFVRGLTVDQRVVITMMVPITAEIFFVLLIHALQFPSQVKKSLAFAFAALKRRLLSRRSSSSDERSFALTERKGAAGENEEEKQAEASTATEAKNEKRQFEKFASVLLVIFLINFTPLLNGATDVALVSMLHTVSSGAADRAAPIAASVFIYVAALVVALLWPICSIRHHVGRAKPDAEPFSVFRRLQLEQEAPFVPFGDRTMDRLAYGFKERETIRKACLIVLRFLERDKTSFEGEFDASVLWTKIIELVGELSLADPSSVKDDTIKGLQALPVPNWWSRREHLTEEALVAERSEALRRMDAHFKIALGVVMVGIDGCFMRSFLRETLDQYKQTIESTPTGGLRFESAEHLFLHANLSAARAFVNACATKNWSFWVLCQRVLYTIAPSVAAVSGSDYAGRTSACALAVIVGVVPVIALKPYKYELVTIADAFVNTALLLLGLLFLHGAATQNPQDAPVASTAEHLQAAIYVMPALMFFACMAVDGWRIIRHRIRSLRSKGPNPTPALLLAEAPTPGPPK